MEYESLLELIGKERVRGASYLIELAVKTALSFLKEEELSKLPEFADKLMRSQPSMAPVLNFGTFLLAEYKKKTEDRESLKKSVQNYLSEFRRSRKKSLENAEKLIGNGDRIVTHSFSSAVAAVFELSRKRGKKFEVYLTESRPRGEGLLLAEKLVKMGIMTYITTDMGIFPLIEKKASSLIFGVDAFLKDGVVNKIGTHAMAEFAENRNIPVFFVGDSFKILSEEAECIFHISGGPAREITRRKLKNLKVLNPYFDITPYRAIRGVVTETGISEPHEFVERAFGEKTRT